MTEAEAEKRWCPFAESRSISSGVVTRVQFGDSKNMVLCVGSQCMAWRWSTSLTRLGDGTPEEAVSATDGHCGLAG